MKNFLDLQATSPLLAISISLKIHGTVKYFASINRHLFQDRLDITLPLHSEIYFVVQLQEFNEGTSGIEIENFTVNGLEVLPKYQHYAEPKTNYIDKLGLWRLEIPHPFYAWHHSATGQGWLLKPN